MRKQKNNSRADEIMMAKKNRVGLGEVVKALEGRILGGTIREGAVMPSVRAVSEQFHCSCQTAYRALRQLAERGRVAAEPRRGYRVLPVGERETRSRIEGTVAFLEVMEDNEVSLGGLYPAQITALQREAIRQGWTVALIPCRHGQSADDMEEKLFKMGAKALIVQDMNQCLSSEFLREVARIGLPIISLDHPGAVSGMDHVLRNEAQGAALASEWLLSRGHRSIAWYGLSHAEPSGRYRYAGAAEPLLRHGIPFQWQGCRTGDEMRDEDLARRCLLADPRPTAVLALWQPAVWTMARAAAALGMKVGKDIDIVGWSLAEDYDGYAASIPELADHAAVATWSLRDMIRTVFHRIAERNREPDLPTACILLPMTLREPRIASVKNAGRE